MHVAESGTLRSEGFPEAERNACLTAMTYAAALHRCTLTLVIVAISGVSAALGQTSTCVVHLAGTAAGGVQSAAVSCTGKTVAIRGSAALTPFSANFIGERRITSVIANACFLYLSDCGTLSLYPTSLASRRAQPTTLVASE